MLNLMRQKAATWVVRILAVFLILSFAAWGIGDMLRPGGSPESVATVGDAEIGAREFTRQYRMAMERLRSVFGPQMDAEQARRLGVVERTLDAMIEARLLDMAARRLGLAVGDDQVRDHIFRDPAFRDSLGQFDANLFQQRLATSGLSEASYVPLVRSQLMQSYLLDAVGSGAAVPDALAKALFHYRNDRRVAEMLTVPRPSEEAIPAPDGAALAEFYEKNKARYELPEFRTVTAAVLDPSVVAETLAVSEADLRNEFEVRKAGLTVPERRTLSQIVLPDEETARKAEEMLKQGRPFAKVAEDLAKLKPDDLSLGEVTRAELPPALAQTAFALAGGAVSAPVQTPLGWHIIRVDKIVPGKTPAFEDVRGEIAKDLLRDRAIDALVDVSHKLQDALAGGASVEEAATEAGAKVIRIDAVDKTGRGRDRKPVADLPQDPSFLETVFDTSQGETSRVVETRDGGYFALRVERIAEPAVPPLDTVREHVVADWRSVERDKRAQERAKALLDRAKGGEDLAEIAKGEGLPYRKSEPVTRLGNGEQSMPAALVPELFRIKRGAATMAAADDGYVVARLAEIRPADPSAAKEELAKLKAEIGSMMQGDLRGQYLIALRERHPVAIDTRAIDQLVGSAGS